MNTIAMIAAVTFLFLSISIVVIAWKTRIRDFHPIENKEKQIQQLNQILEPVGFAYRLKGDYFYSLMYCWQREVGYCRLYDEGAPLFHMIIDCEPITFSYGGKRWLIELWKGQYGITTGAEIGIYNTTREDINTDKFTGTFYECVSDEERMPLSISLKKRGRTILQRSDLHWWLTGFILGEFSKPKSLTMVAAIEFPEIGMADAFVHAIRKLGYSRREFQANGTTVELKFTKPHSKQSINKFQMRYVQKVNKNNCRLFNMITKNYPDTLDKITYVKTVMPELYEIFIQSLYAKGLYSSFDWMKDIVSPTPPKPPVSPCPPIPPCLPVPPCSDESEIG